MTHVQFGSLDDLFPLIDHSVCVRRIAIQFDVLMNVRFLLTIGFRQRDCKKQRMIFVVSAADVLQSVLSFTKRINSGH